MDSSEPWLHLSKQKTYSFLTPSTLNSSRLRLLTPNLCRSWQGRAPGKPEVCTLLLSDINHFASGSSHPYPLSNTNPVLTSRVAWLVDSQHIEPSHVIVVTFTNKAANEMRQRLATSRLLGERSAKVVMGTFHSTCAMFLRRYADKVELNRNFAIADASTRYFFLILRRLFIPFL